MDERLVQREGKKEFIFQGDWKDQFNQKGELCLVRQTMQ